MKDPTPDAWARAYEVLSGKDGKGISLRRAAEAAGVSVGVLKGWVNRSRDRRIEDEAWVHEIAEQYDGVRESQAGVLEDIAWNRACAGTPVPIVKGGVVIGESYKHDNNLLMQMLSAKDSTYRDDKQSQINLNFDHGDLFLRYQSVVRLVDAEQEMLEHKE